MLNSAKTISYMLLGQSNCGSVPSNLIADFYKTPFAKGFIFNLLTKQMENIRVGVNTFSFPEIYYNYNSPYYYRGTGFKYGVEVELSYKLIRNYNAQVNLLKYAWGGAGLNLTVNGGNWAYNTGNIMALFEKDYSLFRMKLIHPPDFLVWIQGESNISIMGTYVTDFTSWITTLRTYLGYNIPVVLVSLSNQQTNISAGNITSFKNIQKSMGETIYTVATDSYTNQSGGVVISDVHVIDHNEPCLDESGNFIHYNEVGTTNLSDYILKVVKEKILI